MSILQLRQSDSKRIQGISVIKIKWGLIEGPTEHRQPFLAICAHRLHDGGMEIDERTKEFKGIIWCVPISDTLMP